MKPAIEVNPLFVGMSRFGVVCDIDGVLVKESHVIKRAVRALQLLVDGEGKFKVPVMFVTNGGNCTEQSRADRLKALLGGINDISSDRMIVSHSPLQNIAELRKQKLLLVGAEEEIIHQCAKQYNWASYQTGNAFANDHPYLFPTKCGKIDPEKLTIPVHQSNPFDSVVILSTPLDWTETLQMLVDVLLPGAEGQSVKLYAANPDLVYSTEYCTPRLTTGAFVACLQHLYKQFTDVDLTVDWVGKPYGITYRYAESKMTEATPDIQNFYAIGDNPLSDIKGANEAGEHWHSILVRSGVHSSKENHPVYPAEFICDDVYDAVQYILEREKE